MRFYGGKPDPFVMPESGNPRPRGGNWNANGKTILDPRPVPGEVTAGLVIWGQSTATNTTSGTYVPVNGTALQNLNVYDGGIYVAEGSLLGCDYASNPVPVDNMFTRVGDKLLSGYSVDRVILATPGMGGTFIAQWESSLYQRIIVACRRLEAQGQPVSAILQQHGEWDNFFGTTQAAYRASGNAVIAKVRAAGITAPWFIAKSSYYDVPSAGIRAAFDQIVADNANVFIGPDTDALAHPTNRWDIVHWNEVGADAAATLWANVVGPALFP